MLSYWEFEDLHGGILTPDGNPVCLTSVNVREWFNDATFNTFHDRSGDIDLFCGCTYVCNFLFMVIPLGLWLLFYQYVVRRLFGTKLIVIPAHTNWLKHHNLPQYHTIMRERDLLIKHHIH